ncbi:MAG: PDZ domain-containing protein [Candidatus Caenarcaniphilales bacterium]|nr:PDZ domain-containing protein [Candidatus Caenarcaniphilales bacterium]
MYRTKAKSIAKKYNLFADKYLYIVLLLLSLLFSSFNCSHAQTFKLQANSSESSYEKSNKGILGVKYLHRQNSESTVIQVYPNTPAERAGVRVGDKIVAVDGVSVRPYDANHVFALIEGPPGSPVDLSMLRCSADCRPYQLRLVRMDMNQIQSNNIFRIYRYGY